ncbi:uncharacterized protein LOC143446889 isoform X2 [Clavelina lepadiformis]|uniref:uncharacterized protein LOC143446889 isoform X2 n=1 Tax=Clavelina lepadiformis TaxID=159417 RepID=UPI004041145E
MERRANQAPAFIHPSRAHLFQKSTLTDAGGSYAKPGSVKIQHVSRTWNNRRDRARETQSEDELLVFGYACKIFPPNEQSAAIAKNRHLIKWNEDNELNLLIDRYDCRASLHNLSEFDGDSWNKDYKLSEEESKLEEHINEERYRAIYVEELEENIRQEEELKRLHASIAGNEQENFGEVAYSYDEQHQQEDQYDPCDPTNDEEEIHKPFIAPNCLAVPNEMEIPPTEKMHAIIEKTATFVSKQGAQMEIVLKAKQANNTQFQFLQFDHYLNPYYKHMVKRMKEGKYTPGQAREEKQQNSDEDTDSSDDDGNYLHPSLFAAPRKKDEEKVEDKTKAIRTIDPDHPLAKLIEKGRQANAIKQYQQMAQAVYGYYQQQQNTSSTVPSTDNSLGNVEPPPLPTFMSMDVDYSSMNQMYGGDFQANAPPPPPVEETPHANSSLGSTGSMGMDSWAGGDMSGMTPFMVPPPPDLQSVVEEIAQKIAVGGDETEKALVAESNPKYLFLLPWHELHPYYQFRKMSWKQALHPPPPVAEKTSDTDSQDHEGPPEDDAVSETKELSPPGEEPVEQEDDDAKALQAAAPISFSIKPRKDGSKKAKPILSSTTSSVLGDVDSDEGEAVEDTANSVSSSKPAVEENVKTKAARRRFSDKPPDSLPVKIQIKSVSQPTIDVIKPKVPTSQTAVESTEPKDALSSSKMPQVQVIKATAKLTPTPSNFTAVTPTGESASISDLRQKQAARRQKALLFLKAKQEQEAAKAKAAEKLVEEKKDVAVAFEDIFDLSEADTSASARAKDQNPPTIQKVHEPSPLADTSSKSSISKLEVLQKLASASPPRSTTPLSSSGRQKRSRSRSQSRSRLSDSRYHESGDVPSSYGKSRRSLSPLDGDGDKAVPSAYRFENIASARGSRSSNSDKKRNSLELSHNVKIGVFAFTSLVQNWL